MVMTNAIDLDSHNGNFLCGVVEGFYGRPWTSTQRRELFKRMNKMGMNTYMYAPKDDSKHRTNWRDLYSVEEADHLTSLIEAATEQNITFVYALSPGLDMTYSSSKEVACLKRKLEQVHQFGCKAFALLFDDIEPDMSEADKQIFQSFGHAQVSVTNEVVQHIGQPRFLFCPTEYCACRAVPNVANSEYLKTIGSKLLPGIDILWTGPKVISKKISVQSIEEVAKVMQRPPVIWDNIHANDYDHKRLFLGPYDGRSPELIPYLNGVLTNPNCEFEANYIAMHTLAQWSKSNVDGVKKDIILSESPVTADIRLETESENSADEDICNLDSRYQPKMALKAAIADWMEYVNLPISTTTTTNRNLQTAVTNCNAVSAPVDINKSCISTCIAVTRTTPSVSCTDRPPLPNGTDIERSLTTELNGCMQMSNTHTGNDSYMQPVSSGIVNSLVDCDSVIGERTVIGSNRDIEPMDFVPTPPSLSSIDTALGESITLSDSLLPETAVKAGKTIASSDDAKSQGSSSETMLIDCDGNSASGENLGAESDKLDPEEDEGVDTTTLSSSSSEKLPLTTEDVSLIVDLFYMPFEHGSRAVAMLNEIHWLKCNAYVLAQSRNKKRSKQFSNQVETWLERADEFERMCESVTAMSERLLNIPNQWLLYDLFPYVWDVRGILLVLLSFVRWMRCSHVRNVGPCYMQGSPHTWSNMAYREAFMSGEQEAWVFRGGVQADFQHMLPVEGADDLFYTPPPRVPSYSDIRIRLYAHSDEGAVYDMCRKTYSFLLGITDMDPSHSELLADKFVGGFLNMSPEYCFVMEDSQGLCGYAAATVDVKEFNKKLKTAWIPSLCKKYPKITGSKQLSPAQKIVNSFHEEELWYPETLYPRYPSVLHINILSEKIQDTSLTKHLLACALSALKGNGSSGAYTEVKPCDKSMLEFYTKLGFFDLQHREEVMLLGRLI